MNINTIPVASKSGYQGYWPGHPEELEFDEDICRAELKADALSIGLEHDDEELDQMVATEARLWVRR